MSLLTVYVPGMSEIAWNVFNGIAAYTTGNDFKDIATIILTFAVLGSVWQYVLTKDLQIFGKFLLIYMVIFSAALAPTSIAIYNESDKGQAMTVDNVPIGIALPAAFTSGIFYSIAVGFESVFHMPDDMNYTQTGMLFGSQLVLQSMNGAKFPNEQLKEEFTQYATQCVMPDRNLGLRTWSDIANAPDIWEALDKHKSPIRGFNYKGQFQTCAKIYPLLKAEMVQKSEDALLPIATKLFGDNQPSAVAIAKLNASLPSAYEFFTRTAPKSAADQVLQNAMINEMQQAPSNYAAFNNATSAVMNYGYAAQQQRLQMANFNSFHMSTYTLPLMQFFFFMFMCAIAPFIILLMTIPGVSTQIFKSYIYGMVWVGSWPVGFAIVNFFVTTAQYYATGYANGGIVLSNSAGVAKTLSDFAGVAGYMAASVPILMFGLIKGLGQVTSQAAQYFGGMQHGISSSIAAEQQTGNYSLGNASMLSGGFNNFNANKHNINAESLAGSSTVSTQTGGTLTKTASGNSIVTAPITSGGLSMNQNDVVSTGLRQDASYQERVEMNETEQASKLVSSAIDHSKDSSAGVVNTWSNQYGWSDQQTAMASQAWGKIQAYEARMHADTNVGDTNATTGTTTVTGGVTAGASAGTPGKELSGTGFSMGGEIGASASGSNQHTNSENKSSGQGLSASEREDYNNQVQLINNLTSGQQVNNSESLDTRTADTVRANLHEAQQHMETASLAHAKAVSDTQLADFVEGHSSQFSVNMMPQFQEFLAKQPEIGSANQANALLAQSNTETGQRKLSPYISAFQAQQAETFQKQFESNKQPMEVQKQNIESKGKDAVSNEGMIWLNDYANKTTMSALSTAHYTQNDTLVKNVESGMKGNASTIQQGGANVSANKSNLENAVQSNQAVGSENAHRSAIATAFGNKYNNDVIKDIENKK